MRELDPFPPGLQLPAHRQCRLIASGESCVTPVFHRRFILGLLSLCCLLLALGCAAKPDVPTQPALAEPYALLKFSTAMQLTAFNQQPIDTPLPMRALRVRPGHHALRFLHINEGPEGSQAHAGQLADPFILEAYEGLVYEFEAKT